MCRFVIYRQCLPRINAFYHADEPFDRLQATSANVEQQEVNMCGVCGLQGNFRCSKCKCTIYCGKECQTEDWRLGHKVICLESHPSGDVKYFASVQFDEYEIVTEPEPESAAETSTSSKYGDARWIKEQMRNAKNMSWPSRLLQTS